MQAGPSECHRHGNCRWLDSTGGGCGLRARGSVLAQISCKIEQWKPENIKPKSLDGDPAPESGPLLGQPRVLVLTYVLFLWVGGGRLLATCSFLYRFLLHLCSIPIPDQVSDKIFVVQLLSHVQLFATPWTAAHQASQFFTIFQSLLKLMSIESVVLSNHLILCCPLLLLPSIFPSIRVFSNESALCIKWPKYWSLSFSISPSMNIQDWFPLGLTGLISLHPRDSQESSPAPQFESINSLALSLLRDGPTLTSVHDYWKNHSFGWVIQKIFIDCQVVLGSGHPKLSRHRSCLRELPVQWGRWICNPWLQFYVVNNRTIKTGLAQRIITWLGGASKEGFIEERFWSWVLSCR